MKIFSNHINIYIFIVLITVSFSCKFQQSVQNPRRLNLSFLYNPNIQNLKAKVVIHNTNDTISTVYCSLPLQQLIYLPIQENEIASLIVHYKLFKTSTGLTFIDSSTFQRIVLKETNKLTENFYFDIALKDTGLFMLDLYLFDKNTNLSYRNYITIEKNKKYNDNDFLLVNKNKVPYFERWLCDSDTFAIILRKNMPTEWKFSWYQNSFKISSPPYSMTTQKDYALPLPDSIRTFLICDTCYFTLNRKGILHIYRDTIGNGKTVFNFSNEFPKMVRPSELLQPIRMLTSQKEFNELNILKDKKEAVDKFWLSTSGNADRAREIIRVFYNRAILANEYFTSYTDGWKTDRGIIYIIFGLPTTIYKSPQIEQWIYGTPESTKVLVFNFVKKYHPFSNNHFVMERNESYKTSWLQAVDTWRNGRIFSIVNQ